MRLIGTFARIGVVVLLGLLLAIMMDPANWSDVTGPDSMTTLEFATAVLDDWHSPSSSSALFSPWPWPVQRT